MSPAQVTLREYLEGKIADLRAGVSQEIEHVKDDIAHLRKESTEDHARVRADLAELKGAVERLGRAGEVDEAVAHAIEGERERARSTRSTDRAHRRWRVALLVSAGATVGGAFVPFVLRVLLGI